MEKKLFDDSIKGEIKDAILESIKELIKESATSEKLQGKLAEVVELMKQQGFVQGYLNLSNSRQKYVLAGITFVLGTILGGFAQDWLVGLFQ